VLLHQTARSSEFSCDAEWYAVGAEVAQHGFGTCLHAARDETRMLPSRFRARNERATKRTPENFSLRTPCGQAGGSLGLLVSIRGPLRSRLPDPRWTTSERQRAYRDLVMVRNHRSAHGGLDTRLAARAATRPPNWRRYGPCQIPGKWLSISMPVWRRVGLAGCRGRVRG
jgi:hypothetical protein